MFLSPQVHIPYYFYMSDFVQTYLNANFPQKLMEHDHLLI